MNGLVRVPDLRNPRIPPFFEFGTADALLLAYGGTHRQTLKNGELNMTNTANNFAAAAFSIIISAGLFAYAIIPASPALIA